MRHLGFLAVLGVALAISDCGKPALNREDDLHLLTLKSKCREDGSKVRSEWIRTYYQDVFSDEPEYDYSRSLQTCLWIGEYRGPSIDIERTGGGKEKLVPVQTHVRFILDVYTNKAVIEYTEHDGKQIGDVSESDFKRRKAQLLGQR